MDWNSRSGKVLACILVMLCLSACLPSSSLAISPTPEAKSLWGTIYPVAQAEYPSAPDIVSDSNSVLLAWIGADDERVFHALKQWRNGILSDVVIPVVPAQNPFEQSIYPAGAEGYHLLWLDTNRETDDLRLFSAYINRDLIAEIAPSAISDKPTSRYTAINDADASLWVVWSGGLLSEPSLSILRIDSYGRPMFPEPLQLDGDYPVLVRSKDETLYLFWISRILKGVLVAPLVDGKLEDPQLISSMPQISLSDRLEEFQVGLDTEGYYYLFWNINREDGHSETYYQSGSLDNLVAGEPIPLQTTIDNSHSIQTGFNSGSVYTAASRGSTRLTWASPLNENADILPVAVLNGAQLGIIYVQGGAIVGYQGIVESGPLLASPVLTTDRDRHLYLSWSQTTAYGVADLNLTTTRQ